MPKADLKRFKPTWKEEDFMEGSENSNKGVRSCEISIFIEFFKVNKGRNSVGFSLS